MNTWVESQRDYLQKLELSAKELVRQAEEEFIAKADIMYKAQDAEKDKLSVGAERNFESASTLMNRVTRGATALLQDVQRVASRLESVSRDTYSRLAAETNREEKSQTTASGSFGTRLHDPTPLKVSK